jgi:hypothetical protein
MAKAYKRGIVVGNDQAEKCGASTALDDDPIASERSSHAAYRLRGRMVENEREIKDGHRDEDRWSKRKVVSPCRGLCQSASRTASPV